MISDSTGSRDDDPAITVPSLEDTEDAMLEGDRVIDSGTITAALRYPDFRLVFVGSFLSTIGTWMQTTVAAAYVYTATGSAASVGLILFATLGPLLALAMIGGMLADRVDNRRLIIVTTSAQMAASFAIAWLTRGEDAQIGVLFSFLLLGGIAQALFSPTFAALMPAMVRREDLTGAIALTSASMNLSRVIGPAIGGAIYATVGASWAFAANAVSYVFIIGAFLVVTLPEKAAPNPDEPTGLRRMVEGFAVARADRVIGRSLVTMTTFSLVCLPFVVQMPVLAEQNFGIAPKSTAYGVLYATFGLGALVGALSIGTFLAHRSLERIVRLGLGGFALTLAALALAREPIAAYPLAAIVGFFYFVVVTSLLTVLQRRLDERTRGRVMALWVMAFGGTVPIGGLIAGPIIDATSVTLVVLFGAVMAALLIPFADLRPPAQVETNG